MKIISCVVGLYLGLAVGVTHGQSVRWTAFEQLSDSLRVEPRPLLIFIHTSWCKYCKMQENITFADTQVTEVLNKAYYCLQLDAESEQAIHFLNRSYQFNSSTGHHELANYLGLQNKELVFPTTVLISKELQQIKKLTGYQSSQSLISELQQFF